MIRINNKAMVEQKGIIFMPDISGFTKFVHDTDIKSGKEIVTELLSTILHTNFLNLKVSEIEGDAILFYRYGPPPTLKQLMDQYELMLIAFKKKVQELSGKRHFNGLGLSLKVIVHYGPIAEYKLYGFKKLYGETIVEAHRLLKNDILSNNYVLVTKDFVDEIGTHEVENTVLPKWIKKDLPASHANNSMDLSFTCFLFNTEILKVNVLQERSSEFFNSL